MCLYFLFSFIYLTHSPPPLPLLVPTKPFPQLASPSISDHLYPYLHVLLSRTAVGPSKAVAWIFNFTSLKNWGSLVWFGYTDWALRPGLDLIFSSHVPESLLDSFYSSQTGLATLYPTRPALASFSEDSPVFID